MSIRRDPEAIASYREALDKFGLLDRPAACLSDEEVIERVERVVASVKRFAAAFREGMDQLERSVQVAAERFGRFGRALQDALAEAAVEEAEAITREQVQ